MGSEPEIPDTAELSLYTFFSQLCQREILVSGNRELMLVQAPSVFRCCRTRSFIFDQGIKFLVHKNQHTTQHNEAKYLRFGEVSLPLENHGSERGQAIRQGKTKVTGRHYLPIYLFIIYLLFSKLDCFGI